MGSEVSVVRDGRLLRVGLARPEKRNALSMAMYGHLAEALTAAETDGTDIVLLTAEGEDFCAGNDLSDFLVNRADDDNLPVHRFLHAIASSTRILLAGVQGRAIGVGATALLHCDFVVAGANAVLSFPFVDLSLVPEAGSSLLLARRVGHLRAAQALMLCEPIPAERAFSLGLVTRLVEPEELSRVLEDLSRALLAKPRNALLTTKNLMLHNAADAILRMADEQAAFGRQLRHPETRALIAGYFARRGKAS